jgi:hypothetical protein
MLDAPFARVLFYFFHSVLTNLILLRIIVEQHMFWKEFERSLHILGQ